MKNVNQFATYTKKEAAEITGFPADKFPMQMSGAQLLDVARRLAIREFAKKNAQAAEGLNK